MFCQQYTVNSTNMIKKAIQTLERSIDSIEKDLLDRHDPGLSYCLQQKKSELGSFLNERVKGALVRSRFIAVNEMDAPSAYFFNLERSVAQHKQMVCLRLPDGRVTTDIAEMRHHAVDFYSCLYTAEHCDLDCAEQLFKGLPKLDSDSKTALDSFLMFEELSSAVTQLSSGRSPGVDGLTSEFYKHFWDLIGVDLYEVFCECF